MSGKVVARLEKLALLIGPAGCPTCRAWTASVLLTEDGYSRPEDCPACGRRVPHERVREYRDMDTQAV